MVASGKIQEHGLRYHHTERSQLDLAIKRYCLVIVIMSMIDSII